MTSNSEYPFYMDGYLLQFVERIKKLRKKDWDICIVVDGKERAGKSKFAQTLGSAIDPSLCLARITFTPQEFHQAVMDALPGQVVIMDEAMTAFFSRAAMTSTNINLVRMLAEVGQKNLIIIIVLPSIFVLDSYLALHRAACFIHIYTGKNSQRGFFKFYDRRRKKQMYLGGKKGQEYRYGKPNFIGRFTNYKFPWEAEYLEKKKQSLVTAFDKQNGKKSVKEIRKENLYIAMWKTIYQLTGNQKKGKQMVRDNGGRFEDNTATPIPEKVTLDE